MSRAQVFDTSVFVAAIRGTVEPDVVLAPLSRGEGYLCAVVAHELLAGTRSRDDALDLAGVLRGFERLGAVVTPTYEDWTLAGRLLEQYQRLYGPVRPADHAHDVLIVLCAAQVHGTVVTANVKHMERWARMARRSGRRVEVRGAA